ncbi:MAG: ABC transporter permease [Ardenticatenales bacterium]|nr:ABC transporter permease [Ardenticatenales bacterium]
MNNNALLYFSLSLWRGFGRDYRAVAMTTLTPLFVLGMFAFMSRVTGGGAAMYAPAVGFALMMVGSVQATRIVSWREKGVFRRLALTPQPLGGLVLGAAGAQLLLAFLQALLIAVLGSLAFGLRLTVSGMLLAILIIFLGAAFFVALGSLVGSLSPRAEVANLVYIFSQLPLYFLGGGLPAEIMPAGLQKISPYLPNTLLHRLLAVAADGQMPAADIWLAVGLLGYTALLALTAYRFFRRD